MDYQQLDAATVPLNGLRLIEASAGTGKTWVIAALYVRAVLGHGGQPPRIPPEILVVTFTRDATAELRERIRTRLEEAAAAFRAGRSEDSFLGTLLADYADETKRARAARQLEVAAQWMDEAAIHTIHGWANRMLTRHAFDSGRSFVEAAEADQQALVADACRDYWRRQVYSLAPEHFAAVYQVLSGGPDALAKAVGPLLGKQITATIEGGPEPLATLGESLSAAFDALHAALADERKAWAHHLTALRDVQDTLEDGLAKSRKAGKNLAEWIELLAAWVNGGVLELGPDELQELGPSQLESALKKGKVLPPCPAYVAAERLAEILARAPEPRAIVLRHALRVLPPAIQQAKDARGEIGFDDMLSELDRALSGPQGPHLAAALRAQLPLAMIDEFQDTDPLQWAIFEKVYAETGSLLLIGDPKQSIYAFRGADIGTYFRARGAAASPPLTLPRNYRSTAPLVGAINALFERADEIASDGAFGYGTGTDGLRFQPVEAAGRDLQLVEHGAPAPALVFALPASDATLNKGQYGELMAEAAAERIATWLHPSSTARIQAIEGTQHRVRPSDIAVLVRTGNEADKIRTALRRRGLASVYLSDKQSVYASEQASDLLHWLEALAEPGSDRALRAALATGSAGFAFAEIDEVAANDLVRDQFIEIFSTGSRLWRERGVLAAVRHLIHALKVPSRMAATEEAERRLTNLLHVAELLQQAAVHLDGEHALIRHLADAIAGSDEADSDSTGAMVQRLESEADLVRVITMHKSKGLQYRLVVIPFPCAFRDVDEKKDSYFEFERDEQRVVSLQATTEAVENARRAKLREAVRLFYVAITRAELACWLGTASVTEGKKKISGAPLSGLGRLLMGDTNQEGPGLRAAVGALCEGRPEIAIEALPEVVEFTRVTGLAPLAALANARTVTAPRAPAWWLSSYSALVRGPRSSAVDSASAAETVPIEEYTDPEARTQANAAGSDMHAFPRGPAYGSFLHYLLEWAAQVGFERVVSDVERTRAEITRRAEAAGLADWVDVLCAWLSEFLDATLPLPSGGAVSLRQLSLGQTRPEFAFMFEANAVRLSQIDRVVSDHMLPGSHPLPLTASHVNGLLSGFIDLVFEHEGAWYTLDYKSNHLADTTSGYTEAAMVAEMAHHRYDLQAALYLLALHRFLRARLADYDPARHIGGVVYPFLRGVGPGTGVFVARPDVAMLDALDALFAGDLLHVA